VVVAFTSALALLHSPNLPKPSTNEVGAPTAGEREVHSPAGTRVLVQLPHVVSLDDLRRHTVVQSPSSEAIDFVVDAVADKGSVFAFTLSSTPARIRIAAGLPSARKEQTLKEELVFDYPGDAFLPTAFATSNADAAWTASQPSLFESASWTVVKRTNQVVELQFRRPVDADVLREHLRLFEHGNAQPLSYELPRREPSRFHYPSFSMAEPANARLRIALQPGLRDTEGNALGAEIERTLERTVPSLLVETSHFDSYGRQPQLALRLNRRFDPAVIAAKVVLDPATSITEAIESWPGVRLAGDWKSNTRYTMTLPAGIEDEDGFGLMQPLVHRFESGAISPFVDFAQDGKFYFARRDAAGLELETRNVPRIDMEVYRLFPSNIVAILNDLNRGEGSWRFADAFSQHMGSIGLDLAYQPDKLITTRLPIDAVLSAKALGRAEPLAPRGLFYLRAAGAKADASDSRLVLQTDLGVVSHWTAQQVILFVHQLRSLQPVGGASVRLYSSKNQELGAVTTGADGIARLDLPDTTLGEPAVAVVESGDDYTFLSLEARAGDSMKLPSGLSPYAPGQLEAFLHGDRELYRPGDTVRLRWLARVAGGESVGALPLELRITKPNGGVLLAETTTLSALGTGQRDITTGASHPTGRHEAELRVPDGPVLESYAFWVEEFVPLRLKASATAPSAWQAGLQGRVTVQAESLTGGPAAGCEADLRISLAEKEFTSEQWPGYHFGNDADWVAQVIDAGRTTTGADGIATFDVTATLPAGATEPVHASILASVQELGGRPSRANASTYLFPDATALGLALEESPVGGIVAHVAAIAPDETPAALESAEIVIEREEWSYNIREMIDHHQARWTVSHHPVATKQVRLSGGRGSVPLELPEESGTWRVSVRSDATRMHTTRSISHWGDEWEFGTSARPDLLSVTLDATSYKIGDVASIRIESPIDGQAFYVLQNAGIVGSGTVAVVGGQAEVAVALGKESSPNAWIAVTLLHKADGPSAPTHPLESFAAIPVRVDDPERRLEVQVAGVPEEIRPGTQLQLQVSVRNDRGLAEVGSEVTLAAVDEGIHALTGYRSPDPLAWLRRLRQPNLRRAHYLDHVAFDFAAPRTGGDGSAEAEMANRGAGGEESWIKPVALWSGLLTTDGDGLARVTLDVPEFSGTLRIVAIANSRQALGMGESSVKVRRPYEVKTHQPRIAATGDTFRVSAVVANKSAIPCIARVGWIADGALIGESGETPLTLEPGEQVTIARDLTAGSVAGQGMLAWKASFEDAAGKQLDEVSLSIPLPIRSPATYIEQGDLAIIKPGETHSFHLASMVADDRAELEVRAGAEPHLQLEKSLEYVVGYPHGCVEQTTSRLLPMLVMREHGHLGSMGEWGKARLDEYIQAGIDRLASMQTGSGGLAYWPGGTYPSEYGSVYALHFLALARGSGHTIPDSFIQPLIAYVRGVSGGRGDDDDSLHTKAYAIYSLALCGEPAGAADIERMDGQQLPQSARDLLAAAVAHTSRDGAYASAILGGPWRPAPDFAVAGILRSTTRDDAVRLMALNHLGGRADVKLELATKLSRFLATRQHGNTQESALVLTALSLYLRDAAIAVDGASARITGPDGIEQSIAGKDSFHGVWRRPGAPCTIVNTGTAPLHVTVTRRGIPLEPVRESVQAGLKLERVYRDAHGAELTELDFAAGRSYLAELTITADQDLEHVIVVDRLAAGLEIDNPRLDPTALARLGGATPPGQRDLIPSHLDLRDDRLIIAADRLAKGTHRYRYAITAITPGTYELPPARAECMYDELVHGQTAAGSVTVR